MSIKTEQTLVFVNGLASVQLCDINFAGENIVEYAVEITGLTVIKGRSLKVCKILAGCVDVIKTEQSKHERAVHELRSKYI